MPGKVIAVSGGFDPLHIGHLAMLQHAKELGRVVVLLNTDEFLIEKKGYVFMPYVERYEIVNALYCVDEVIRVLDVDMTVRYTLMRYCHEIDVFLNGGDRNEGNIPEADICRRLNIELLHYGDKIQSSSELVSRAEASQKERGQ